MGRRLGRPAALAALAALAVALPACGGEESGLATVPKPGQAVKSLEYGHEAKTLRDEIGAAGAAFLSQGAQRRDLLLHLADLQSRAVALEHDDVRERLIDRAPGRTDLLHAVEAEVRGAARLRDYVVSGDPAKLAAARAALDETDKHLKDLASRLYPLFDPSFNDAIGELRKPSPPVR